MALNTYLKLKLDGANVSGSVIQKGREGTIEVHSLEWSFDSDGNIGEIKFVAFIDKATPAISNGLKNNQVADAEFEFYTVSFQGTEDQYFTLHGTNGQVTSVDLWMPNNKDTALQSHANSVQYTMSFEATTMTREDTGATSTISTIP